MKCDLSQIDSILFYFQLQLIFDELDTSNYFVHERFLYVIRKINQIKLSSYDKILSSVRAKNISLILQIRRNKKDIKINDIEKNMTESSKKEILEKPITFNERQTQYLQDKEIENEKIDIKIQFHNYWENRDHVHLFDGGIFYEHNSYNATRSKKMFNSNIEYFQKKVKKKKIDTSTLEMPCFKIQNCVKPKLYKFFYYDKGSNKWQYNNEAFAEFVASKSDDTSTPLIFLFNSKEEDCITLCSNLILSSYPEIDKDDNDIYVYGLWGLPLSMLNARFKLHFDDLLITPIFLIFHPPAKEQQKSYPNSIFFQIFVFLYFISDLVITILDENYFASQFDLNMQMEKIIQNFVIYENKQSSAQIENEDDNDDNHENVDKKSSLLTLFNNNFVKKKLKLITLFNHKNIFYNSILIRPKHFYYEEDMHPNFIKINDPYTYQGFINSFNVLLMRHKKQISTIKEIKMNFQYLPLFEMSSDYFYLKDDPLKLKQKITKMYKLLKKDAQNSNSFIIISKLQEEILKSFPILDREYANQCNLIITELSHEINQGKSNIIANELSISSKNNLTYLSKMTEDECYLTEDQMDNIKNSHINFLKNEFFNIIKSIYPKEKIPDVYHDNENILLDQIKKDFHSLSLIFTKFVQKLKIQKLEKSIEMEQGTNYTIRERENEREIKVRVEINGDIEKLIPTDY